jgi:hypothetical protein
MDEVNMHDKLLFFLFSQEKKTAEEGSAVFL